MPVSEEEMGECELAPAAEPEGRTLLHLYVG